MAGVMLRNVCKTYDKDVVAVNNFNLEIQDKEFVVFVGPSGCGKTTTLRMVAGLEQITSGEISIGEKVINNVAPKDRDIAMVFQNYALYPHMTVFENMAFSLKLRKIPKKEIEKRVIEAARILNIENLLKRQPKQLSGGQRQRVAIGRAIVRSPQVFLMDEPLSNLDAKLRNQMRAELIMLHKRIDTTIIYVTHDQVEAMTLGDRIVVMKDGVIQQAGSPQNVFNRPANMFVAGFIGTPQMNFIEDARLEKEDGKYVVRLLGASYTLSTEKQEILKRKDMAPCEITAGIRPEDVEPCNEGEGIRAFVELSELMGSEKYIHVNVNTHALVLRVKAGVDVQNGGALHFTLLDDKIHLFDKTTNMNLLA